MERVVLYTCCNVQHPNPASSRTASIPQKGQRLLIENGSTEYMSNFPSNNGPKVSLCECSLRTSNCSTILETLRPWLKWTGAKFKFNWTMHHRFLKFERSSKKCQVYYTDPDRFPLNRLPNNHWQRQDSTYHDGTSPCPVAITNRDPALRRRLFAKEVYMVARK